jgi:hypothetical protein
MDGTTHDTRKEERMWNVWTKMSEYYTVTFVEGKERNNTDKFRMAKYSID